MTDWLICGLGNPGAKYANTPHNIGFITVDTIAESLSASWSSKFKCEITTLRNFTDDSAVKVYLAKPQSFMNLSGEPLSQIAKYYKVSPANIIVIHDDIDLEFGRIKLKLGGGSGGHNGIKSIDKMLGTPEYYRIRIGVGRSAHENVDAAKYVLGSFSSEQQSDLPLIIQRAEKAASIIISEGLEKAQMVVH